MRGRDQIQTSTQRNVQEFTFKKRKYLRERTVIIIITLQKKRERYFLIII